MKRNRLLVVDGDPRTLRVLEVSLRSAGFAVDSVPDGLQAWATIEATPPDLVIADSALEGMDGFALCARMRDTPWGAAIPFILLGTDQTLANRVRALEVGAEDYLVKPAYVQEVLARVRARLQRRDRDLLTAAAAASGRTSKSPVPSFSGDLTDVTVVDLVQLMEAKASSGVIHLRGEAGTGAAIYVRQGKVVDAEVGQLAGMDALLRLFAWARGTFELEWKTVRRKDVIEREPAALVIEGMQKLDEGNRLRGSFPDATVVFEVDYRLLSARLAEIPDEMNAVLKLCDGVRSLEQLLVDCPLPDVDALTALIRLREEGIVFSRGGPDAAPAVAARAGQEMSSGAYAEDHEGRSPTPPRRRTAPGLGDASAVMIPGSTAGNAALPAAGIAEAHLPPRGGNVISFPSPQGPAAPVDEPVASVADFGLDSARTASPPSEAAPHEGSAAAFQVEPPLSSGDAGDDDAGLVSLLDGGGQPLPMGALPRPPGAMSRTQRGFGPGSASDSEALDSAVPMVVTDPRSSDRRESSGEYRNVSSGATVGAMSPGGAGSGTVPQADASGRVIVPTVEVAADLSAQSFASRREISDKTASARQPRHAGGTGANRGEVLAAPPADATERIRYPDDELAAHEAHEELGLPSRWRGVRFMILALAVGGLAAIVTHRLRSGSDDTKVVAAPAGARQSSGSDPGAAHAAAPAGAPSAPVPNLASPEPGPVPAVAPAQAAAPPTAEKGNVAGPVEGVAASGRPAAPTASAADRARQAGPTAARPSDHPPVVVPVTAPPAPRPPAANEGLSDCRTAFARNRMREALAACTAAVAANPRSAEALTMLAHSELNRGNLSRAGELAEKAVTIDPNMADAYVIAGGVHQDSGRNSAAKVAYRRYLQLAPHGRYADELRSIVNSL